MRRAMEDFTKGVCCACGVGLMALLCYAAAFSGVALGAIGCACGAVFCWVGAALYFQDAKINRRKSQW